MLALRLDPPPEHDPLDVNITSDSPDIAAGDGICDTDPSRDGEQCSLRAAIQESNARPGRDSVRISSGRYIRSRAGDLGDDSAASADLDILEDLLIEGAGSDGTIIDGNGLGALFQLHDGATLELRGVSLTGGLPVGAIQMRNAGSLRAHDVMAADRRDDVDLPRDEQLLKVFSCGLSGGDRLQYLQQGHLTDPIALGSLAGGAF